MGQVQLEERGPRETGAGQRRASPTYVAPVAEWDLPEGVGPGPRSREASGPADSLVWPGAGQGVCREECTVSRDELVSPTARLQGMRVVMLGESSSGPGSGMRPSGVWGAPGSQQGEQADLRPMTA